MPTRLLMLLLTISAVPVFAQQSVQVHQTVNVQQTIVPASFDLLKMRIDSLAQVADTTPYMERSVFNGKVRAGRYRVECYYDSPTKEILKCNYLIITDSLNYNKIYYFRGNSLIKVNDNNTAHYYQVGDKLLTDQGSAVNPAILKNLKGVIEDSFQGLYTALFQ